MVRREYLSEDSDSEALLQTPHSNSSLSQAIRPFLSLKRRRFKKIWKSSFRLGIFTEADLYAIVDIMEERTMEAMEDLEEALDY